MLFLGFFRPQNPTTLPPRDATCVLCLNSCTPCLGGQIGHAHMLPKVGVISCMPPHALSTSRTIRVCWSSGLKLVFLDGPTKWSQTSRIPYDDHGMHACVTSIVHLRHSMHFLGFSDYKTLQHYPHVAQRAFCVRIRAHLAWGTTLAKPTISQKLGSSHACFHMQHVQAGPFGSSGGQV